MATYFFNWLITSGISSGNATFFIFLTNWAFLAFNSHLIISALAVTAKYVSVHFIWKLSSEELSDRQEIRTKPLAGCCGYRENDINWYQMVQWLFYLLGTELAVIISILYWALLYSGGGVSGVNANTHLVNGLFALVDTWICGIPTNTLHVVYIMIFGAVYVVFTGVYFALSGNIVYDVLDYENSLGLAIGISFAVVILMGPLVHILIFYSMSKLQELILYCTWKIRNKSNGVYY